MTSFGPYLNLKISTICLTLFESVIGLASADIFVLSTEIFIAGFLSMFLYQFVSEPFSGSRYSILDLYTNHTGLLMLAPELLPMTDNSISLDLSKASLNADVDVELLCNSY